MMFAFNEMSAKVSDKPAEAAAELRKLVLAGKTGEQIAQTYGVERRTVTRWFTRLREKLGSLDFALREGRRPSPKKARRKKAKSRKRRGASKNC